MGNLLYVGTYGSDDPTRATMPMVGSTGALDKGHKPSIFLMGEAALLMKDSLVDTLHGVGFPPLRQLMLQVVGSGVPLYIRRPCAVDRGVTDADLAGKNARYAGPDDLAELMMAADRVISF